MSALRTQNMGYSVAIVSAVAGGQTVVGTRPLTLAHTGAMLCVWQNVTNWQQTLGQKEAESEDSSVSILTRVQDGQSRVSFVAGARHSSLRSTQPSTQWEKIKVHPIICHEGTRGVEVQHYSFCNLLSTCALPVLPTRITWHSLRRRLGELQGRSGWVQKILPPWFQTPNRPAHSKFLYWLHYSGLCTVDTGGFFIPRYSGWDVRLSKHSSPSSADVKNQSNAFVVCTDMVP